MTAKATAPPKTKKSKIIKKMLGRAAFDGSAVLFPGVELSAGEFMGGAAAGAAVGGIAAASVAIAAAVVAAVVVAATQDDAATSTTTTTTTTN